MLPNLSRRAFLKLAASLAVPLPQEAPRLPSAGTAWDQFATSATPADFARLASKGKWQLARHLAILNRYLLALASRRIKRLIVTMPPRHGKSSFVSRYFPAWWLGTFPDDSVMITSYGHALAGYWARRSKEAFEEFGPSLFNLRCRQRGIAGTDWAVDGREGKLISAGIGGALTGFGANLLICDDYCKSAAEASSVVMREATYQWWLATASTRLEPDGVAVIFATRWHEDDLIGRLLRDMGEGGERWHVLNLPALSEREEPPFPKSMGRHVGDALWPQRYNVSALAQIRKRLTERWWASLYQQRPAPQGGDLFKRDWFYPITRNYPAITKLVRFWDMAATAVQTSNDPDYSAGCKMGKGVDGRYYIFDVTRFRENPGPSERIFLGRAYEDGPSCAIRMEMEGGSGGKIAIHHYSDSLRRHGLLRSFDGVSTGGMGKEMRAEPLSQAAESGMIRLVDSGWDIKAFLDELEMFPAGIHDDQVDAASGAYAFLFENNPGRPASAGGMPSYATGYQSR